MSHRKHDFDQPGNPGRGFQVTEVGFDGTDAQRPICRSILPENRRQTFSPIGSPRVEPVP